MVRLEQDRQRIAGTKQVLRAIRSNRADCVYLAEDADAFLRMQVQQACEQAGIVPVAVESMKQLGALCKIQVGAAVACTLKTDSVG